MAVNTPANPHFDRLVARLSSDFRTVGEMVYEMIRSAILEGAFAPGERLRQEALATKIGVSRIPVRSALIQLESEGLVTFHPRRGAMVRSLDAGQLQEIYELREVLEPHVLRKSMATMTPERLDSLRSLARQLDEHSEGTELIELRMAFYRELYDATNNPQTVKMIEELRSAIGRYLLRWRITGGTHSSHSELVAAVATGDVELSQKTLLGHLGRVREGVQHIADEQARSVQRV